jgi:imidazolonepropionase-like amidohydrolase
MKRLLFVFSIVSAALCEVPGAVAIHNARIIPVSAPPIARGTVLVRNGLIEAAGANVTVPPDAWVIEAEGLTVYPGLIDALSTFGIPDAASGAGQGRGAGNAPATTSTPAAPTTVTAAVTARGPEDRPNTTSWINAADLIRTTDPRLEPARSAGFTTAVTFPTRGIFAGKGAVLDLAGEKPGQMIVAEPVGQYLTLASSGFGGGYPGSLMGTIAYIRQIYLDADHYRLAKQSYSTHARGVPRPEYDRALEGVLNSPRILLPAARRVDVDRMIRFAAELKQNAVFYGLTESYRSVDLLKKANATALINLRWPEKPQDGDPEYVENMRVLEVRDKAPSGPGMLAKSGVKFAFYSGGISRRSDLVKAVKRAIDAGLSADDALRAMTLSPAEIYGVADRMGSIEPGKIANLVVTKGDLFEDSAKVQYVFVDGVKFEPVPETAPDTQRRPAAPTGAERPVQDDMPVRTSPPPESVQPPAPRPSPPPAPASPPAGVQK